MSLAEYLNLNQLKLNKLKILIYYLYWSCHIFISYMWLVAIILDCADIRHFTDIEYAIG